VGRCKATDFGFITFLFYYNYRSVPVLYTLFTMTYLQYSAAPAKLNCGYPVLLPLLRSSSAPAPPENLHGRSLPKGRSVVQRAPRGQIPRRIPNLGDLREYCPSHVSSPHGSLPLPWMKLRSAPLRSASACEMASFTYKEKAKGTISRGSTEKGDVWRAGRRERRGGKEK
jgi:hypothetical protein